MYDTPLTNEQILSMIATMPSRRAQLTEGLSAAQLVAPPEPFEWSVRDVLAHLRACADMWSKYIMVTTPHSKSWGLLRAFIDAL